MTKHNNCLLSFFICAPLTILVMIRGGSSFAANPPREAKGFTESSAEESVVRMPENRDLGPAINKHSLGVGLGETFLAGGLEDNGENRITFDLYYDYSATYTFDFLLNVHYSEHKYRGHQTTLPGVAVALKGKVFQFDNFAPFVLGGLGFYRPKIKRDNGTGGIQETEGKTTIGVNLGVGGDLRLNPRVKVGVLFHYHNPFDVKQDLGGEVEGHYSKLLFTSMYTF